MHLINRLQPLCERKKRKHPMNYSLIFLYHWQGLYLPGWVQSPTGFVSGRGTIFAWSSHGRDPPDQHLSRHGCSVVTFLFCVCSPITNCFLTASIWHRTALLHAGRQEFAGCFWAYNSEIARLEIMISFNLGLKKRSLKIVFLLKLYQALKFLIGKPNSEIIFGFLGQICLGIANEISFGQVV